MYTDFKFSNLGCGSDFLNGNFFCNLKTFYFQSKEFTVEQFHDALGLGTAGARTPGADPWVHREMEWCEMAFNATFEVKTSRESKFLIFPKPKSEFVALQ